MRSDSLDQLTAAGWSALREYGVRTIIDLRNADERPTPLESVHVPIDDVEDREFWDVWDEEAPPLYYGPFLARKPERCAAVVRAIARAEQGGVVFHCGGGRDRTGLVTLLLLALAGVEHEEIASDYELSYERMRAYYATHGEEDQSAELQALLARAGTSAREVLLDLLAQLDAEAYLRAAGVDIGDLATVQRRLQGLQPG